VRDCFNCQLGPSTTKKGGKGDRRDGSEHALVYSKHQIRNPRASHTRRSQHVPKTNVSKIPNVFTGIVGEGQGITPEEPLKGDDADRHQGEPDEREGGLAAGEARIEESDTRNHEENEGGRGKHPGNIAGLSSVKIL